MQAEARRSPQHLPLRSLSQGPGPGTAFPACRDPPLTAHLEPRGCQRSCTALRRRSLGPPAHCGVRMESGGGGLADQPPPELQQLGPGLHPAERPAVRQEPLATPAGPGVTWLPVRPAEPVHIPLQLWVKPVLPLPARDPSLALTPDHTLWTPHRRPLVATASVWVSLPGLWPPPQY